MNNSKNRHLKTLNKIPRIIFLFSIIATIISIIVLCSIPGNRETISCDYESFSNGWVTDNGSKADLSHITGKYMVHNTIPLLSHDSKLFFFLKTSIAAALVILERYAKSLSGLWGGMEFHAFIYVSLTHSLLSSLSLVVQLRKLCFKISSRLLRRPVFV